MKNALSKFGVIAAGVVLGIFVITSPMMVKGWQKKRALDAVFAQYSRALIDKNYRIAYSVASSEFSDATPFDTFSGQLQRIEMNRGELKAVDQGNTTVEGNGDPLVWVGTISATLHYSKGDTRIVYEFHVENDQWRLFGFKQIE